MSFFSPNIKFHLMAKPSSFYCNIQCEYCFYLGKKEFFGRNSFMSKDTLKNYIKNYINSSPDSYVEFMWQGGEPTLLGLDFFQEAIEYQQEFSNGKIITNAFQTNGIALNHKWMEFFKKYNFLIGLSIDGLSVVHNRYRISNNGNSTFDKVVNALELLKSYQVNFNTLTVVNDYNWNKGKETYQALKEMGSTFMQFIPIVEKDIKSKNNIAKYSVPPKGYGYFLFDIFQEWNKEDIGKIFVLEFDDLLGRWLGYPSSSCIYQSTCGTSLIVEANGDIYSCDHYVYPEYKVGNINTQSLVEILQSENQKQFGLNKLYSLTQNCQKCRYRWLCQGGCPKHRIISFEKEKYKHNYLCDSYYYFFQQTETYMKNMVKQIRSNRT